MNIYREPLLSAADDIHVGTAGFYIYLTYTEQINIASGQSGTLEHISDLSRAFAPCRALSLRRYNH